MVTIPLLHIRNREFMKIKKYAYGQNVNITGFRIPTQGDAPLPSLFPVTLREADPRGEPKTSRQLGFSCSILTESKGCFSVSFGKKKCKVGAE